MRPWIEIARNELAARGNLKLENLVQALLNHPESSLKKSPIQEIIKLALNCQGGLRMDGYPAFRLKSGVIAESIPKLGWRSRSFQVLADVGGWVPLDDLLRFVERQGVSNSAKCPMYWLYRMLTEDATDIVTQRGSFEVGLADSLTARLEVASKATRTAAKRPARKTATGSPSPILGRPTPQTTLGIRRSSDQECGQPDTFRNFHEAHVEEILLQNLHQIEAGLDLIGAQYSIPPVGRIDILCKDKQGRFVVIEVKKLGVTQRMVIGQIAAYMGAVKAKLAAPGQIVRGIVIVFSPDEQVQYAKTMIPGLEIKCWTIGLKDA